MLDIVIDDGEKVLVLDTLGQGSYIGAYGNLLEETYNYSARGAFRAGTVIFTLKTENIKQLRQMKQELDRNLLLVEEYIEKNGLP